MKNYIVTIKEVWSQDIVITANSSQEAIDLVESGEGCELKQEKNNDYLYTLDKDEWSVECIGEDK